jgi:hypothetical protein
MRRRLLAIPRCRRSNRLQQGEEPGFYNVGHGPTEDKKARMAFEFQAILRRVQKMRYA